MPKDKVRRFQMDTATFVSIWRNHTAKSDNDEWKKFVLNCFERFTSGNEHKNKQTLLEHDKNWTKWKDDEKYEYLSEKCYSKCIGIKRRMKEEHDYDATLPKGYLTRGGSGAGKRLTSEDILNLFKGEA